MSKIVTRDTEKLLLQYMDKVIHCNIQNPSADPELNKLVTKLQTHTHGKNCMKHSYSRCRFKFPHDVWAKTRFYSYVQVIKKRGKCYELQRNADSTFINSYNPVILRHFRSNMDLQLVNNAESISYHVCAYICKSEPDELRSALGHLFSTVFPSQQLTSYQKLWNLWTGSCISFE